MKKKSEKIEDNTVSVTDLKRKPYGSRMGKMRKTTGNKNSVVENKIEETLEKKTENAQVEKVSEESATEHEHGIRCVHNHLIRFKYAFMAIILVLICAAAEYYYNSQNPVTEIPVKISHPTAEEIAEVSKRQKFEELDQKLKHIEEEIAYLNQLKQLIASQEMTREKEAVRKKKWSAWTHLAGKLHSGENYKEELDDFRTQFSENPEVISMVEAFIKDAHLTIEEDSGKEKGLVDISKQYLNKIIKINKVDDWKLHEISGYVLISLKKCTTD